MKRPAHEERVISYVMLAAVIAFLPLVVIIHLGCRTVDLVTGRKREEEDLVPYGTFEEQDHA